MNAEEFSESGSDKTIIFNSYTLEEISNKLDNHELKINYILKMLDRPKSKPY